MNLRHILRGAGLAIAISAVAVVALFLYPQPLFAHHVAQGRLTLYSDRPFTPEKAGAVLADAETRLATSPLDDHREHAIFITNAGWRRMLYFNVSGGAAGINRYPLTDSVFIRKADVDADRVFGASGKAAEPPRTLAYYIAHEVTHSFTAKRLGPGRLWNRGLPQWVREGYADYVGLGGKVDVDALWRRRAARDPSMRFETRHTYDEFRLLVAFYLTREHWSVEQLLASELTLGQAEARMDAAMR